MKLTFITLLVIFLNINGYSQLTIDTTYSPVQLVRKVLLGNSEAIKISDVDYTGYKSSIAKFQCSMKYNELVKEGIILSTGNVFDAIGPNDSPNKSSKTSGLSSIELEDIAEGKTFDASILEFKFTSSTDSISIGFFFASEEYPEFVKKNVNDAFAFFLIDEEIGTKKNLAVLQSSNTPISIDNINSNTNSENYIENGSWDRNNIQKWTTQKQLGELAYTFQFDGMSTLQNLGSKIIPNKKYILRIIIVDVGDRLYDSAIFLEANSFYGIETDSIISNNTHELIVNKFGDNKVTNTDKGLSMSFSIEFKYDSDQITGDSSFLFLEKVYDLLNHNPNMTIEVHGHSDSYGTFEYNHSLSSNRANNVANYLISMGIESNRIKSKGFGYTKPISLDNDKLNRRVEFIFSYE